MEQILLDLQLEVEQIKEQLPNHSTNDIADFEAKLAELRNNPYTWKIVFPNYEDRKAILREINQLKKRLNCNSNYELIKYLLSLAGNNTTAS
jgi:hypothetical protein